MQVKVDVGAGAAPPCVFVARRDARGLLHPSKATFPNAPDFAGVLG